MSAMSELSLDIATMLDQGMAPQTIARILEVPTAWVYEVSAQGTEFESYLDITEMYSPFETVNS